MKEKHPALAAGELLNRGLEVMPCSDWHRLSIQYDGIEIVNATVTCKRPENSEQMNALLRELIAINEAHDLPDEEVLGSRSI